MDALLISGAVRDFQSISVDRKARAIAINPRVPEASPSVCRGKSLVLFVTAEK